MSWISFAKVWFWVAEFTCGSRHTNTQPLAANDSPQNRARNRRVELILTRGLDENFDDLDGLQELQQR